MPFVTRGQTRLYYEAHGEGPPLVLAHGVGGNHASWFHQIASLSSRFRVIVFDARGFGNSDDVEGLGRSGFVDDLVALLDELSVDKAFLVGQSMGGGTCLSFTCRFPDRVRGLVLADTLMGMALPEEIRGFMAEVTRRTADLSQAERVVGPTFRRRQPALTRLYLELASFNGVTVRTLTGEQRMHEPEELGATGVPTLFVVGEEDVLFPPEAVRAVQRRVAESRFVEIADSGHSAYFERPDVFDHVVTAWLDELGA
jgi:pimeloyl-ACP methyl ester carboxylesterase